MHAIAPALVDWLMILLCFGFIIGIGVYLRRFTGTGEAEIRPALWWGALMLLFGVLFGVLGRRRK
jgi:LPXTG-motif cell wall-anchored protein